MTDTALKTDVWTALNALPKPVTIEQVRDAANGVLSGKQKLDFGKWLDISPNSLYVLRRLNG